FVRRAIAVEIPGEKNTLAADETLRVLQDAGLQATKACDVETALQQLAAEEGPSRVLICGSLYLAGRVLEANG
ncbi:MAG: bifunctional folylpolyglutamate synthase/dihydrofolate synthase, partial [Alphaproteobacteria bacterium]